MKGHHTACAIRRVAHRPGDRDRPVLTAVLWFWLPAAPAAAGWMARGTPAWAQMTVVAVALFAALKLVTLRDVPAGVPLGHRLAYVGLWPGLNAPEFLTPRAAAMPAPSLREIGAAWFSTIVGCGLGFVAGSLAPDTPLLVAGWLGLLALILLLHFGILHLVSCTWRALGVNAPPIMQAPLRATSLAEFWSARWNVAFAQVARRFLFRPFARRWGVAPASAVVFLVSGLVHEAAISWPARGGWGGPTAYFVLQGIGVALERRTRLRRWLAAASFRGRVWTIAFTALPVPLLFHPPFAERVIAPLFRP